MIGREIVSLIEVGEVEKFGYPVERSLKNAKKISEHLLDPWSKTSEGINFIFVDGCCRVLTLLACLPYLTYRDVVMIHDFTHRAHYRPILHFFELVLTLETLVVLKLKTFFNFERL